MRPQGNAATPISSSSNRNSTPPTEVAAVDAHKACLAGFLLSFLSLQASTLHQAESLGSEAELWPEHGSNADKHQLVAVVMDGTVPQALC